jgi:DNA-directed RNA polymerase specialized sigma24 family protein
VVHLDEALTVPAPENVDLVALDRSLEKLAAIDERKVRVVELRYFGGLTIDETAEATGCSPMTVKRDWTIAKAWLFRDLSS